MHQYLGGACVVTTKLKRILDSVSSHVVYLHYPSLYQNVMTADTIRTESTPICLSLLALGSSVWLAGLIAPTN